MSLCRRSSVPQGPSPAGQHRPTPALPGFERKQGAVRRGEVCRLAAASAAGAFPLGKHLPRLVLCYVTLR